MHLFFLQKEIHSFSQQGHTDLIKSNNTVCLFSPQNAMIIMLQNNFQINAVLLSFLFYSILFYFKVSWKIHKNIKQLSTLIIRNAWNQQTKTILKDHVTKYWINGCLKIIKRENSYFKQWKYFTIFQFYYILDQLNVALVNLSDMFQKILQTPNLQ